MRKHALPFNIHLHPDGYMIRVVVEGVCRQRFARTLADAVAKRDVLVLDRTKSSPFRGVYQKRGASVFYSQITSSRRSIYLGAFETAEEAARAYDAAARKIYGAAARLNFP